MSAIHVRGLTLTHPGRAAVRALDGVDLDVADGQLLAVLGPSGCGKTTLLRSLAGLDRPDEGRIEVGGVVLEGPGVRVKPERRPVGLVPQEGALFPHLDVAANVAFGLRSLDRRHRTARVSELLALVGLEGFERRRPHQLSGGQQQRVALARALAPGPEVVLLDEPFSALDTGLRTAVRDEVADALSRSRTTAILVTHDQAEAMAMADVVAVMRDGRIVQTGPPLELYRRPADLWTARFLGEAIVLPGERSAAGTTVQCALGQLDLDPQASHEPGPRVTVCLRPEQVRRAAPGTGSVSATVRAVRFHGPDGLVVLDLGAGLTVSGRWPAGDLPATGEVVELAVTGAVLARDAEPESGSPAVAAADDAPRG